MMLKRKLVQILIITLFIAGIGLLMVYLAQPDPPPPPAPVIEEAIIQPVNSFEECVEATNLVFTTSPSKCIAPDGQVFVNPTAYEGRVITEVEKVE
jgi:hypothetical protein